MIKEEIDVDIPYYLFKIYRKNLLFRKRVLLILFFIVVVITS